MSEWVIRVAVRQARPSVDACFTPEATYCNCREMTRRANRRHLLIVVDGQCESLSVSFDRLVRANQQRCRQR
jgi:hypothetical protein